MCLHICLLVSCNPLWALHLQPQIWKKAVQAVKKSSEMYSEVAEGILDISELLENRVRSRSTYLFEIERRRVDIETSFLSDLAPG